MVVNLKTCLKKKKIFYDKHSTNLSLIHDRYCGINCCMMILKLSSTIRASGSPRNGLEVKCVEEGLSRSPYLSLCLTMQHVDVLLFASNPQGEQ